MNTVKLGRRTQWGPFPPPGNYQATQPEKEISVRKKLQPVKRELANLEAERGETTAFPGTDGMLNFYDIGGKRHAQGGTPLNLPEKSFIFSDYKTKLKIKDPTILDYFGKGGKKGKKGYTPAELSKQYDINDYLQVLHNPNSTPIQISTAERMIKNYTEKIGQIALVQESVKGFPNGIPEVAYPYLYKSGIQAASLLPVSQNALAGEADMAQDVVDVDAQMMGQPEEPMSMPMARYGMELQPRVRDISIPRMQKGGSKTPVKPTDGDIVVDYSDDAYQLEIKLAKAQKDNPGKKVFVEYPDGKFKRVEKTVVPRSKYAGKQKIGDLQKSYEKLDYTLRNDPKLQDEIYNNYRAEVEKMTNKDAKDRLLKKTKGEVIDNFLKFQEQVYALNTSDLDLDSEEWDKSGSGSKNKKYQEAASKLGFDPLDEDGIRMGQAAYWGAFDAAAKPEFEYLGKQFNLGFKGANDELRSRNKRISLVDGIFGNTTNRQGVFSVGDYELIGDEAATTTEAEKTAGDITPSTSPTYETSVARPEWWTQNVVDLQGALSDQFGIKKYYPNLFQVDMPELSPTFMSPERALAANAEQANIATQGIGAFAGPQALSARQSNIQGQAARQAADILGQINNQNVQIANQFEMAQQQLNAQERASNVDAMKRFYDENTLMNQQYDNAIRQARAATRLAFNTGLTAAQQTAAQNALYPHYQVDPSTGQVVFTRGSKLDPASEYASNPNFEAYLNAVNNNPNIDPNVVAKFFTKGDAAGLYPDPTAQFQQMMGYYNG